MTKGAAGRIVPLQSRGYSERSNHGVRRPETRPGRRKRNERSIRWQRGFSEVAGPSMAVAPSCFRMIRLVDGRAEIPALDRTAAAATLSAVDERGRLTFRPPNPQECREFRHVWPRFWAHVAKTPKRRSEAETEEPPPLPGFLG